MIALFSSTDATAARAAPTSKGKPAKRTPQQESEFRDTFKDAMYRIIDHYSTSEAVLFVDPYAAQVVKQTPTGHSNTLPAVANGCTVVARVVVLTTGACYIMERLTGDGWRQMQLNAGVPPADASMKKSPGMLLLRRRIPFPASRTASKTGIMTGVVLSKLADCCVLLQVTPPSASLLPPQQVLSALQRTWAKDDSSAKCTVSGTPFSLFNRRHHCRVTGQLVCQNASLHAQLLPDMQLHTPQRIGDPVIGLVSCDPLEDIVILTARKTEVSMFVETSSHFVLPQFLSLTGFQTCVSLMFI